MIIKLVLIFLISYSNFFLSEEITPYKITDQEIASKKFIYKIPESSRFTIKRLEESSSKIVYYLSKPKAANFPIAICSGGSSSRNNLCSIIHLHRYLLQEFLELNVAVLTVEQQGIDGEKINEEEFIKHYTRSIRLHDHQLVIESLKSNPPVGWNGKIILLGISEGGPIVTTLTEQYSDIVIATINWSGAGDWSWRDELWAFIESLKQNSSWLLKLLFSCSSWIPYVPYFPKNRSDYDACMNQALMNPTVDKEFMGMTYKYHADALLYPQTKYEQIKTPFLVVAGVQDSFIGSSDDFVEKSKIAGVNVTYLRIEDMDHYIRNRPEIIEQSFQWLSRQLK